MEECESVSCHETALLAVPCPGLGTKARSFSDTSIFKLVPQKPRGHSQSSVDDSGRISPPSPPQRKFKDAQGMYILSNRSWFTVKDFCVIINMQFHWPSHSLNQYFTERGGHVVFVDTLVFPVRPVQNVISQGQSKRMQVIFHENTEISSSL